jgi:hypothetical protein
MNTHNNPLTPCTNCTLPLEEHGSLFCYNSCQLLKQTQRLIKWYNNNINHKEVV